MQRGPDILLRLSPRLPIALSIIGLVCFVNTTRLASADAMPLSCSGLKAVLSDDKNSYMFTTTVTGGSADTITGYTFDFGDRQSYTFTLGAAPGQNNRQVTVEHSYLTSGVFTATVRVDTKVDSKSADISSPACRTTVNTGPKVLVNTGAGNTLELFTGSSFTGFALYQLWLRYRHTIRTSLNTRAGR